MMTTRILLLVLGTCALTACTAHVPLKAPCPPIAALGAVDSCGPEKPLNVAML